jgi:arylsulfatase
MRPNALNVVLILADDLGYSDVGVYGAGFCHAEPRPAGTGGMRLRIFMSRRPCARRHAALLTGCYASRVGIEGNAMEPWYKFGIHRAS